MSNIQRGRVVIYGGGVAGAVLAKLLCKDVKVTLVDPLDYFEVPMAAPRSLVDPDMVQQSIIAFSEALPQVEHIQAKLIELTPEGGLIEQNGQYSTLHADVSVLATGSQYANPLMRSTNGNATERQAFYQRYHTRLSEAERILIVGGGPIGVEVAAEIIQNYPSKLITLLDAGARLLRGTSEAAALHASQFLSSRGVNILLNQRLKNVNGLSEQVFGEAGVAQTDNGQSIPYDLLIWCGGGKANTSYMHQHYSHLLNVREQIRVNAALRSTIRISMRWVISQTLMKIRWRGMSKVRSRLCMPISLHNSINALYQQYINRRPVIQPWP